MLCLVDRYLLAEVAKVFAAIVATLLLITLSLLFLRTLEEVNLGALNTDVALRYLGYQILRDSAHLLPPAFFVAVLVALGRMARDSELIALQAGGLGAPRIYRALLYFAVPLALLTGWLALVWQPLASAKIQTIRELQNEQATQIAGLQAGRYYQQDAGQLTFYATALDGDKRLRGIFLRDQRGDRTRLVLAETGYYTEVATTGERFIVLEDGRRYDGAPGMADYSIGEFARYRLRLTRSDTERAARRKRSSTPTRELLDATDRAALTELQHRLANPLAIFALTLIAIPLTATSPRQTGGGRLLLAFLAYFAFFNLQRLAESWLEHGVTPIWIGSLWYQFVVVSMVATVLVPDSFWIRRLSAAWPFARG